MALDKPTIGIRQADGSFYDIMEESQAGHKRLVLSAARTDQRGVKIDLYRSVDGNLDGADALGSIELDDQEGLGFKDIEFRLDLDEAGLLNAAANLPGQPPQRLSVDLSEFQPVRSDHEILGDDTFDNVDLDTLDETFTDAEVPDLEPEPLTMDLPELDEPAPGRTDVEILGDETLETAELDTLDDFADDLELGSLPDELTPVETEDETLEEFSMDTLDEEAPLAPASFDLGDLDAGFGDGAEVLPEAAKDGETIPGVAPEDDWESIDLDGLEPMEFLDTGDEISAPSAKNTPPDPSAALSDDFSLDDEEPLELGDLDSDLSDLPDLEELGENSATQLAEDNDLDQDFLAPPALTDLPEWEPGNPSKGASKSSAKQPKKEKDPHHGPQRPRETGSQDGGLDKTALFLSLTALVLLVILILVLLVLNVFRSPVAPVIQPEVQRWKPLAETSVPGPKGTKTGVADLGSSAPPTFESSTALEIPQELGAVEVTLNLAPGDTVDDAIRRFGQPAKVQGNLLYW